MKKLRVISCAVYFLLAAVLLMPCVLALDIKDYSAIVQCPQTGRNLYVHSRSCGLIKDSTISCLHCGSYHKYTYFANHIWKETGRTESTVHSEGTIQYKCSVCGTTTSESIPKLECSHDWQETGRTEPTTEAAGAVTYQCSICGKSRSEVLPKLEIEECTHDWKETDRIRPTETTPGQITYTCSKCGEVRTESIPARSQYDGTFVNWLGSVAGLFDMTLNRILGFNALRLHVGVLVFMAMFSLLVKLIRQGRKGQL